ncbi:type I glutamate--ammonia ligase [Sinimarinibacterium sp. NLF-5-8]|uniref:type I glutamate--ammonia ligase n=1 Tax=Sinimarinibacterium sp. NLF-5-8 TaxID=2698684 RepID=UPI00137BB12E|nr:type I glutamate--ammonia ligase [Sinimarinibacterium sp. NLF-5-8]QHS09541.1 type I glutamate--ammonia ligase [Sinimarinibacterium sp. NLF-5-8]
MSSKTQSLIQEHHARWVDLRFTDTLGKEQHVTFPAQAMGADAFENGKMFDGSSIHGWKGIEASDMVLMPDDQTAVMDPFASEPTVIVRSDVLEPSTMQGYDRDPRSIARRAELYLRSTGIADTAYFGPEPEFFVFDAVQWKTQMQEASFVIHSAEGAWANELAMEGSNPGHRPRVKGGYFPVPPVDSLQGLRTAMCSAMQAMGLDIEVHHHEVANAGQCEIGVPFNTLVSKADEVQILKYCVHNVAHANGKTATFMPKPLVGDNGSGMHVHQSLFKDGKNLFSGSGYSNLSETALYYIGGIIHHARALNAITNPGTNSYKRLVPGFEAPVMLAYSASNRSASIRIPWVNSPKARRIECRFPDPSANPYLCFAALLMAGLDGIRNKIHPGDPLTKNLYHLPPEESANVPRVAHSLDQALDALMADKQFLLEGGVFTADMLDAYVETKMAEVTRLRQAVHPVEFDMYYSL